jgi:hypothetical protein
MSVGKTVRDIFGGLPNEDILRAQPVEKTVLQTNLHIHLPPNFGSIGSVEEAIEKACAENIAVLGASNYYDHSIYTSFAHVAVKAGIVPVFGIEILTMNEELRAARILINDPKNPGKAYLCGKGLTCFDHISEKSLSTWIRIQAGDKQRIEEMITKLNAIEFLKRRGIQLHYAEIAQTIARDKRVPVETVFLQERHITQALQHVIFEKVSAPAREALFQQLYQTSEPVEVQNRVKVQDDLRNYLLKQGRVAYIDECFVSPEEAAELILELGGYVSCPVLIDGAPQILPGEGTPEELTNNLLSRQIAAAEFIPTRNDRNVLTDYVKTLRNQGIVVGAGTEHNTADWIPLLPHCRKRVPLGDELTRIFWEGACVAVAHQYLRAKGKAGYQFRPDKAARETQIQTMSELGAQVIGFLRKS